MSDYTLSRMASLMAVSRLDILRVPHWLHSGMTHFPQPFLASHDPAGTAYSCVLQDVSPRASGLIHTFSMTHVTSSKNLLRLSSADTLTSSSASLQTFRLLTACREELLSDHNGTTLGAEHSHCRTASFGLLGNGRLGHMHFFRGVPNPEADRHAYICIVTKNLIRRNGDVRQSLQ